uniref:protein-tyrosine-phosphatase n=1 Tax=Apophua simplicipes ichnovirus TaxID=1329648 RepID=S5DRA4_9VIRU|nr:AsIV-cont00097-ORF1 [Apophua simplicipes ichnovirus]
MGNIFSTKYSSTRDYTLLPEEFQQGYPSWKTEYVNGVCGRPICESDQNQPNSASKASSQKKLTTDISYLAVNRAKNRYRCIPCFDHSRVVLTSAGSRSSDYIHANYIDGFDLKKKFIATQAPITKRTVNDFYDMIWENRCEIIVVLANFFEAEGNEFRPYWPMSIGSEVGKKYILDATRIDDKGSYAKFFCS